MRVDALNILIVAKVSGERPLLKIDTECWRLILCSFTLVNFAFLLDFSLCLTQFSEFQQPASRLLVRVTLHSHCHWLYHHPYIK